MSEGTADPRRLRVRAGLAFVPLLRPALYALLVASALFTFWSGGEIAGRALPRWTQVVAPTLFAIFIVVFAIYRFALMRAKKYPAASGFFQIGLGALIWVLLLPGTRQKFAPAAGPVDQVPTLIQSPDPRVRAMAAEVAGYRAGGARYAGALIAHLDDGDARVREMAHASLVRLAGTDAGPTAAAWRALAAERGW
ncbi:MAG TPA: HEAT repeat domain-containing protein [Myxococcales bacterium]|nr:HEAT repeat domain-containing protein [Myxococcales bacterium]